MIPQIAKTIIDPIPSVTSAWSDPMPIIPKMATPINVAILGMMCVHRARLHVALFQRPHNPNDNWE